MNNYQTIKLVQSGETVTITLNRPKLNFVNDQMIKELTEVFNSLRNNTSSRFVILTAQGKHFSAGVDLNEINKMDFTPEKARIQQLNGHDLMRSLESLEQITVAALRGVVCGAGMALAQACDFRIMSEDSFYLVPETNVGTYYTWGCTPRLVRMIGASKAMEIIMTCDPVSAQEAYRLGLANKIVPSNILLETTNEFIAKIMSKSPYCIRITKKIALGASMEGFGNMFICEPELLQGVVYSGDTKEGIEAFIQKRTPKFN